MTNTTLFTPLFSEPYITEQFSPEQTIAYLVQVEVALGKVQSRLGVIPAGAGDAIEDGSKSLVVDMEALHIGIEQAGIPTIELVKQLRDVVDAEYATYVHWGATSQDIMDTALILQLRACITHIEALLQQVVNNFAIRADEHRHTLMVGRTHSQHALPITFGLKVAGWIAPLIRHQERLTQLKERLLVVQFGGAVGTLASLGHDGVAVAEALAEELGLGAPVMAWHTQRDNLVEFAGWLSMMTGSLGKMAQDIILMAQSEVAEIRESDDPARGGSSTMPQKSNPIISELIVTIARTNASLLSAMHQAMIQEHERATGSWQIEWLSLPQMVNLTAVALSKALFLGKNLVVDVERMKANVKASNGLMMAEAISRALAPKIGRERAKTVVKTAVEIAIQQNRHLVDVLQEQTDIDLDWDSYRDESRYLGTTDEIINRVLKQVQTETVEHD